MIWFIAAPVVVLAVVALADATVLRSPNAWILVTTPIVGSNLTNSVIGYSYLLDGSLIHKENLSPLQSALAYNGFDWGPDGYSLRTLQPFLVSVASPFLGLVASALLVNYLAYSILVVATARLAYRLTGRVAAALVAGALGLVGLGPILHLNDLSPHLLGFAFYALVVAAVYESGVWREKRPLRVHLALGCLLALASFEYPTGITLAIAYLLTALPWSRWTHVAAAGALGLLTPAVLAWFLTALYANVWGRKVSLASVDQPYFFASAGKWLALAQSGPLHLLHSIGALLLDSLFVAFPLVTLAGLVAILLMARGSRRLLWFLGVFFAAPYLSMFVFSQQAEARGYIVYGSSLILYASVAAWLTATRKGVALFAGWALMAVLLLGQLAWSLAYLRGYYFPLFAFYVGYSSAPEPALATIFQSATSGVTGASNLGASGLAAGSLTTGDLSRHSLRFALLLKGLVLAPAVGLLYFTVRRRLQLRAAVAAGLAAWLVGTVGLAGLGVTYEREVLSVANPDQVTLVAGPQEVRQTVQLSAAVVETVKRLHKERPDLKLVLFTRSQGLRDVHVTLGGATLPATELAAKCCSSQDWAVNIDDFVEASSQSSELTFEGTIVDGFLGGWQTAPLPGRTSEPGTDLGGRPYTPSLELRLLEVRNGTPVALLIAY